MEAKTQDQLDQEFAERAEFIKGLRALADYVEQYTDLPTPTVSEWSGITVSCYVPKDEYKKDESGNWAWVTNFESDEAHREAQVARFSEVCRAMVHGTGAATAFEKKSDDYSIKATRKFSSNVKLTCSLSHEVASCEQVVIGTRVVEEPDPEQAKALREKFQKEIDALPKVEVVKEDKKWICPPSLLAPASNPLARTPSI